MTKKKMYNVLLFTDGGWMVDQKEVIHENTVVPFLYFAEFGVIAELRAKVDTNFIRIQYL
jgi:hypothetical protein